MTYKDSSESVASSDAIISLEVFSRVGTGSVSVGASGCSGIISGMANGIVGWGIKEVVLEHTETGGVVIAS